MMIPATPFRRDGSLNIVVETPRGSTAKFKYDEETGSMIASRPLPLGVAYPYDWGFVAGTRASDGDPLDAMVLWDAASYPGIVVPSRIVGALTVDQRNVTSGERERNDRLFVLPVKAPRFDHIRSIFDLAERVRSEIEQFFVNVVMFEQKDVHLLGFAGPDEGERLVRSCAELAASH